MKVWSGVLLAACASASAATPPYAIERPLREPTLFAPGIVSTGDYESHGAFAPDGRTVYFIKNAADFTFWTIFESHHDGIRWSSPTIVPFSGQYKDADPFVTADGRHLFFISDRPVAGKSHHDLDIWVADRDGDRWGEPRPVGAPVNSDGQEWYPFVAASGTIYFGSDRAGGLGKTDLYRARFIDGHYTEAENLGAPVNGPDEQYEPFLTPDERTLFFMGDNRDGRGDSDLFVSYRDGDSWTKPEPIGAGVNSAANEFAPHVSPDGRYFFWSSTRSEFKSGANKLDTKAYLDKIHSPRNGLGDIYQIDIEALGLKSPHP